MHAMHISQGMHGAGAPLPTDQWHWFQYPFGGYGQEAGAWGNAPWYLVSFALGFIIGNHYARQQG